MNIVEKVHELYWEKDINCARTTLICLGDLLDLTYAPQVLQAAAGLHGAGGFGAQCGLVEGGLMFLGLYYSRLGKSDTEIAAICYDYAKAFTDKFGSLACRDLRPNGFSENDPPHMCEELTSEAISFTYHFIRS